MKCQDSWSGSTGSITGKNAVKVLAFEKGLEVQSRRSPLVCTGALTCSFRDPTVLKNHDRYVPDDGETRDLIIQPPQEMNARAGALPNSTLEYVHMRVIVYHPLTLSD